MLYDDLDEAIIDWRKTGRENLGLGDCEPGSSTIVLASIYAGA